jgi:hypothetical protein
MTRYQNTLIRHWLKHGRYGATSGRGFILKRRVQWDENFEQDHTGLAVAVDAGNTEEKPVGVADAVTEDPPLSLEEFLVM